MLRSSLALLLLAFSASASAQQNDHDFDYNFFQLDYSNVELDDTSVDGDGFGLSGSYAINSNWHVFGSYQDLGLDFGADATLLAAGVGYNTEISPVVDGFARLSYQDFDLDAPGPGGFDDDGLGFGVGLRFAATPLDELSAAIDYVDYGSSDDTRFSIDARHSFTDSFSLGLAGSWGDNATIYTLGGRLYFGK